MKVKLGDVCEVLNGYAFKSSNYVDSGIRVIRIANVQKGYIEDNDPVFYPVDSKDIDKYMLKEDDLLISLTGNVGRVAILKKEMLPAALNQRVSCLRLRNKKILNKFLFYILNSDCFEQRCIQAANGVAQKNISTEWLKNYEIQLYSVDEQKDIVDILDYICSIIDNRRKELKKLDDIIKARFVEMFGDVRTSSKFPNITLESFAQIGSSKRVHAADYVESGVPFYRSKEIIELGNGQEPSVELFISEEQYKSIKKTNGIPYKGDILMSAVGTIGKMWIVDGRKDFYYKDGNIISIHSEETNSIYLKEALANLIDDFKSANVTGSAYSALTIVKLKKMTVPMPSIELQNEFAAFVTQVDKSKVN